MVPPTTTMRVGYHYRMLLKVKRLYEAYDVVLDLVLTVWDTHINNLWTLLTYAL